jgi:hypothetical protein
LVEVAVDVANCTRAPRHVHIIEPYVCTVTVTSNLRMDGTTYVLATMRRPGAETMVGGSPARVIGSTPAAAQQEQEEKATPRFLG